MPQPESRIHRRWNVRLGRMVHTVLLLLMLILLGIVIQRRDFVLDLSIGQRRTLAPQTLQVLDLLDRPVHMTAFFSQAPQEETLLNDLVERYRKHNSLISLEFVDLDRRPELAREKDVTVNGTVLISSGDLQLRVIQPGEAEFTGGLLRILQKQPPRILFLIGHGEASIDDASSGGISQAADLLRRQNYRIDSVHLPTLDHIGPDVSAIVLPSPEAPISDREQKVMADFIARGGGALFMVEPMGSADADSFLLHYGIIADAGFLVDPSEQQRNLAGEGNFRIAMALGGDRNHPVTRGFSFATLYPLARSISSVQPPPSGVIPERIVTTSPNAWRETDLRYLAQGVPRFDEESESSGPFGLAYALKVDLRRFRFHPDPGDIGLSAVVRDLQQVPNPVSPDTLDGTVGEELPALATAPADTAKMVVVGDVDFINNANLLVQGNSQLFLSMMSWISQQEIRAVLPPPPNLSDPVVLSQKQRKWIRILGIGAFPGIFLLLAFFVLWRRSRWL